ncbi:hypothetical protein ABL78_4207 [Leptomonas seymouri]|uniref:Uncharacterized protein n=1 Tax=Leptomonas seymouri TaxID=5684 RepID=A0A0N0P646_LEPSE|nr:hypothetical protein ABL78_4207 [Leptomonas seymouri]|eukprot:KPI86737.1 hypothetical protein ABL78_4207 [Leptomonas seymouri]
MPFTTLSSVVQASPAVINSSLEKLSCSARGIDEVDIYPAVLSALTANGAPYGVAESVRAFMQAARQHRSIKSKMGADARPRLSSFASPEQKKVTPKHEDSYMESFNVGIAMSLHTVLLSRNHISTLLGIVQFKHCVRLSLLGNRIRTIEDCEPLALLPDLQYLSLEFNPVAQLPHYRAHLLRICSWPQELSTRTCRLRKLDSVAVTSVEVKHAVLCLQREQSFLPELLYRMQLLAFLGDMEKRNSVHRELRQRAFVFQQTAEAVSLETTLERGAAHALGRVSVSGAAHLARLLVRDRHRLMAAQSIPHRPFSKDHPGKSYADVPPAGSQNCAQKREAPAVLSPAGIVDPETVTEAADAPPTTTFSESDQPDTSNIASVSSVASCSFATDQSEEDVQMLLSLSNLLGERELDWSRAALRRSDAAATKDTCKEWSRDAFRQTLAFLDVRTCAALLRMSRGLGQSLNAHDVDRLCQLWLHAVAHCVPAERLALNVTGPRRLVVTTSSAAPRIKPKVQERGTEGACELQSLRHNGHGSIDMHNQCDRSGTVGDQPQESCPTDRLPVEAAAQARRSVWEVGEQDGCLSDSLSFMPVELSGISDGSMDISMTSPSSSDTLIQPRQAIPLPTAANYPVAPRDSRSEQQQKSASSSHAHLKPSSVAALKVETNPADASVLLAEKMFRRQVKRYAFQQWCTSLRHRWQSRIAVAYIRDKISEAAVQPSATYLRSPSWGGLLRHATYIERKRGFFNCWRRGAAEKQAARAKERERVSDTSCVQSSELPSLSPAQMQEEEINAAEARWSTIEDVFRKWKGKAEQKALLRCSTARQRVLAATPHTPETYLSLHPRSVVLSYPLSEQTSPSSPITPRQQLEGLRQSAREKDVAENCSPKCWSLSPVGGFRCCNLAREVPVMVTKWQSASTPVSAPHSDAYERCALEEEEGPASVAPSSSAGISVNSATTPFLAGQDLSQGHVGAETLSGVSSSHGSHRQRCPQSAQILRASSPPPAIRILFPTEAAASPCVYSLPAPTPRSLSNGSVGIPLPAPSASPPYFSKCPVEVLVTGRSAIRFYGGTQPSRLPSTTTARRAIIASSDHPCNLSTPSGEGCLKSVSHRQEAASPYPAEDVEALVTRAKQLEADRVFLLSEVGRLSSAQQLHRAPCTGTSKPAHTPSVHTGIGLRLPAQSDTEDRCAAQQREIQRLESIVAALRDERHSLLKSVKAEIFQF